MAEVKTGFLTSVSGNTVNQSVKPGQLNISDFNRLNLAAGGSLGINYRLRSDITLHINSNFSSDLFNNLSQTTNTQKFSLYGVRFGIYYSLQNP